MNTLLLTAWIACQSLDVGTTAYGLQHGFREANPAMRGSHAMALKVSVNIGAFVWHRKIAERPNAWVIPVTMAAGGCVPGALNLQKIGSQR